jgi:hypothetical protein
MLTSDKLKEMEPNTILASGIGLIEHPWFNNATLVSEGGTLEDDRSSTKVKWVAIRGGYYDWAIYHSMDANISQADNFNNPEHLGASNELIARAGAKLHREEDIKKFVPCDEEAFKMYRY